MENKKLKYEIESCIETIDVEDSVFAPAKIMIGYCGDNRNWSNIREEVFAEAPIKNIPVVANFYSDKNDFGGHDVKVIQNKDGIDIYAATVPFGLVPESAKQWFTEEFVDGEMKKCYWTECLLWKRQYGFNKIAESKRVNHSMEIDVSEYTERPDGYCVVDKMKFEALCLLGEDVEPCFENSRLELFSVDNFEKQFTEMLEQYKAYSLKLSSEVNEMEENKVVEEVVEEQFENVEDTQEEVTEETVESDESESISVELETEIFEDTTESEVVESTEEVVEENTIDYSAEYTTLKEQHDALMAEVEELREYKANVESEKRSVAESEVFAKFEKLNDIEAFTKLKESASEYSIEDLEEKCFAIAGKYGINLFESTEEASEDSVNTKFSLITEEKKESVYGDVFERYKNRYLERK